MRAAGSFTDKKERFSPIRQLNPWLHDAGVRIKISKNLPGIPFSIWKYQSHMCFGIGNNKPFLV